MMNPDKEKKFGLKGIRAQVMICSMYCSDMVCIFNEFNNSSK